MSIEVKLLNLPESVSEATIVAWHYEPGDRIHRDDNLVDIETDKVVLEVPSPCDGVVGEILKQEGSSVVANEVIARIDAGEDAPAVASGESAAESAASEIPLSPAVRRLVTEHAIDPAAIKGTGRNQRILKEDVLNHLKQGAAETTAVVESQPVAEPAATSSTPQQIQPRVATSERSERRQAMPPLRRRIAERLLESQRQAAILTTFNEVDMSAAMSLRGSHKARFEEQHGARLGFMSFFVRAATAALQRFPVVNASIDGEEIVYHDYYDIGIAVGSPRGLVVPILRDCERLGFAAIEGQIADFANRAGSGRLAIEELSGGTFTITNGGVFGSMLSTPIINPPQSAILGLHKIQKRPVAIDDQVVIRPMMYLALSYDHRLIDGRDAVQFLVAIKERIEDPTQLLFDL